MYSVLPALVSALFLGYGLYVVAEKGFTRVSTSFLVLCVTTFFWQATGPLDYDMHAHPFDGGTDLTESYAIEQADHLGGRYVAPFTGIHGWYWQNRSLERVTLTLDASGNITGSKLFGPFGEQDRELTPQAK